jgi:hypothetical protein
MKATVITLTALILGGIALARAEATVLKVKADVPTDQYGGQASSVAGDVQKQAGDNFRWRGGGRLTWEVSVDQPGEYEVNLCHAAETNAVGQQLQISSGQSQLNYALAMTQEVFGKKSYAPHNEGSNLGPVVRLARPQARQVPVPDVHHHGWLGCRRLLHEAPKPFLLDASPGHRYERAGAPAGGARPGQHRLGQNLHRGEGGRGQRLIR